MSLPYRIRVPLQAIKKRSRPPSDSALITEETWTAAATPKYLQHILTSKVYDVAQETPLQLMTGMSKTLQNKIYLKREDMQPGFSFKIRGGIKSLAPMLLTISQ
jgi:tryptophan synthase beta subunit